MSLKALFEKQFESVTFKRTNEIFDRWASLFEMSINLLIAQNFLQLFLLPLVAIMLEFEFVKSKLLQKSIHGFFRFLQRFFIKIKFDVLFCILLAFGAFKHIFDLNTSLFFWQTRITVKTVAIGTFHDPLRRDVVTDHTFPHNFHKILAEF